VKKEHENDYFVIPKNSGNLFGIHIFLDSGSRLE